MMIIPSLSPDVIPASVPPVTAVDDADSTAFGRIFTAFRGDIATTITPDQDAALLAADSVVMEGGRAPDGPPLLTPDAAAPVFAQGALPLEQGASPLGQGALPLEQSVVRAAHVGAVLGHKAEMPPLEVSKVPVLTRVVGAALGHKAEMPPPEVSKMPVLTRVVGAADARLQALMGNLQPNASGQAGAVFSGNQFDTAPAQETMKLGDNKVIAPDAVPQLTRDQPVPRVAPAGSVAVAAQPMAADGLIQSTIIRAKGHQPVLDLPAQPAVPDNETPMPLAKTNPRPRDLPQPLLMNVVGGTAQADGDHAPQADLANPRKVDRGTDVSVQSGQDTIPLTRQILSDRSAVITPAAFVDMQRIDKDVKFSISPADSMVIAPLDRAPPVIATAHSAVFADPVRHMTQQLVVAVVQQSGGTVEIALNPSELGRVQMNMQMADGLLTMHIIAERPETADLLRRHLDVLTQDFRAIGYHNVAFSFGDEPQRQARQQTVIDHTDIAEEAPTAVVAHDTIARAGLDLRL
jgi:flagellar hook-length control protein FliK